MHKKYKGQTAVLVFASITAAVFLACTMEPEPEESFRVEIIDHGNAVQINSYLGTNTKVRIPSAIQGLPVTSIRDCAFQNKGLEAVIIPEGVTNIGFNAFWENRLSHVALPNSLRFIGESAFGYNRITFIDIPNSVTYIGAFAFTQNLLTDIIIPAGVSSLSLGIFSGNMISNIVIPKNVADMDAREFDGSVTFEFEPGGFFYTLEDFIIRIIDDGSAAEIFQYLGSDDDVVIPAKMQDLPVTAVGNRAFFAEYRWSDSDKTLARIGHQISGIVIPEGVTSIGANAFMENRLTDLEIPDSVTFIGTGAFSENMLASVSLPEGGNLRWIESHAFRKNQLTSVVIPSGITSIDSGAFFDNKLTSIVIPNGVTDISYFAFAHNQLTSVAIPKSVTDIKSSSFDKSVMLEFEPGGTFYTAGDFIVRIIDDGNAVEIFKYLDYEDNVVIPERIRNLPVTGIGYEAFLGGYQNGDSLQRIQEGHQISSVVIPKSVIFISDWAFALNLLTKVVVPNSEAYVSGNAFDDNVTVIKGEE